MRRVLIGAWILAACSGPAPEPLLRAPAEAAITDLGSPGAVSLSLQQLASTDALVQLKIPEASTGPLSSSRSFTLSDWRMIRKGPVPLWSHALPIHTDQAMYRDTPPNLDLSVDGVSARYLAGTATGRAGKDPYRWELTRGRLFLRSATAPDKIPVVLHQEQADRVEARLNLRDSGLDKLDFIRLPVTLGDITRESLLLPAPAQAVFRLTLPPKAQLRTGFGLARSDLRDADVEAQFMVSIDGTPIWEGRTASEQPWQEATVDLSAWAGKTVELQLSTTAESERAYTTWATPTILGAPTTDGPRRVVLVGIDTLRPDHLRIHGHSRDTSPGLDAIGAQSLVMEQARAPAPRTRPSFQTALTGRWPTRPDTARTLPALLRETGFRTAGIVANIQLAPRLGFARGFEWYHYDNMTDADVQVDRALAWLKTHQTEDTALFLHLMDPHIFYQAPEPYLDMFTDGIDRGNLQDRFNRWTLREQQKAGKLTTAQKDFIRARYDGEIAFLDAQVLRLVNALDAMPGRTLLVLFSDHGEEFWEHDGFEHNHTLYEELVRAMLWIRPPGGLQGGPHRVSSPASLADVLPTVLSFSNVEVPADIDGQDLADLLPSAAPEARKERQTRLTSRALPLGHMMFDRERWGVVVDGHKYILQTTSGEEELYDLSVDPGETQNLVNERDLSEWPARLSEATGYPVVQGWRVQFTGLDQVTTLRFKRPLEGIGVIDPEAGRRLRANLDWGEQPAIGMDDVATLQLSEDRRSVEITPGPEPTGTVYLLGPTATDTTEVECSRGRITLSAVGPTALCHRPAQLRPGPIILPTADATKPSEPVDPDSIEALKTLGYVQ